MTGLIATLLSIAMLASFALIGGGGYLFLTGRNRKQGMLMFLAAFILLVNVLIWVMPVARN